MKVLFAAAEAAPFAKAGGLADVVGSLPKFLRSAGVDARVVMPLHGSINRSAFNIAFRFQFQFPRRRGLADVFVHYTEYDGVPFYFLESFPFFGSDPALYTAVDWDIQRFIAFSEFTLALIWQLSQREQWLPDVLHAHDWHTGLSPFLVANARHEPTWAKMGTVITIHNMGYQAPWSGPFLADAGIPPRTHPDLLWQGKSDNILGIGLAYSDVITTVSPRYAAEIQSERFGEDLQGITGIRNAQGDVIGILNGLDMVRWDPATDRALPNNFDVTNYPEKRAKNKAKLQADLSLPQLSETPLVGIVSRLTEQKGFDLAFSALQGLLGWRDMQVVMLGSGETYIEEGFRALERAYPGKMRTWFGFNGTLSNQIYGACDIFLMPSRYEPCGTGQMIALRYGALPLVRETGGLADTVQNYDNAEADYGTGFVFQFEESSAVYHTLNWALDTYIYRRAAFQRMQGRGMQIDWGWEHRVPDYIAVYERAINKHS
ncbi:MAG: glycogen synthase [Anaerolineae bacterium]